MGAAATKERPKAEQISHRDGCPAERIESYDAEGSRGTLTIVRCIDCGAQKEMTKHG